VRRPAPRPTRGGRAPRGSTAGWSRSRPRRGPTRGRRRCRGPAPRARGGCRAGRARWSLRTAGPPPRTRRGPERGGEEPVAEDGRDGDRRRACHPPQDPPHGGVSHGAEARGSSGDAPSASRAIWRDVSGVGAPEGSGPGQRRRRRLPACRGRVVEQCDLVERPRSGVGGFVFAGVVEQGHAA
jgi:hypothetical protein